MPGCEYIYIWMYNVCISGCVCGTFTYPHVSVAARLPTAGTSTWGGGRMGNSCDKYFHYSLVIVHACSYLSMKNQTCLFPFNGQAQSRGDRNIFALIYVKALTDSAQNLSKEEAELEF